MKTNIKKLVVRISLPLDVHLYGLKKEKKSYFTLIHIHYFTHVHNWCENIHIFTYKSESKIRDVKQFDV